MKSLEKLVIAQPMVMQSVDPLQFAYQTKVGVDDAIIYVTNQAYTHLEGLLE